MKLSSFSSIWYASLLLASVNSSTVKLFPRQYNITGSVIDQLYLDALAEGGNLVVYEGGDGSRARQNLNNDFNSRFPGMNATFIVNLSKYHDIDIDNQLEKGDLIPSVAHIQTVNDFYRWKEQGHLLQYKPPNWDQVYSDIKDPEGYFTALNIISFAPNALRATYASGAGPIEDEDFLDPKFKNRIVLTYPHDDDAVLYQFDKLVSNHGWEFIDKLIAQNVTWVRGTGTPVVMIGNNTIPDGVTFTSGNSLVPNPISRVDIKYPQNSWFLSWGQAAAIFKKAPHPAAAKLFMAWFLSDYIQKSAFIGWSSRMDIAPKAGYKHITEYPNTSRIDFIDFMRNRTKIESLKLRFEKLLGHVQGQSPLLDTNQ
ncbi:hypothetical protein AYI69_g6351 [Smittium culicis]|uniref:Periplasmic binding protein-like II n=2 Tax=Smittium culicis TaxID=133412 RepID=A0A1R1XZF2_9FUNG|nr:hypothetical protein AYI69_g6351 [Smittium culicis]